MSDVHVADDFPRAAYCLKVGIVGCCGFPIIIRGEVVAVLFAKVGRDAVEHEVRMVTDDDQMRVVRCQPRGLGVQRIELLEVLAAQHVDDEIVRVRGQRGLANVFELQPVVDFLGARSFQHLRGEIDAVRAGHTTRL